MSGTTTIDASMVRRLGHVIGDLCLVACDDALYACLDDEAVPADAEP